jgi:magnesium transporter
MKKREVKKYKEESAGSLMTARVPLAYPENTIEEVGERLISETKNFSSINYIYVVSEERKLLGVISVKELFIKTKKKKIEDIMIKDLISVNPDDDQEKAAMLSLKYNIKQIPVVDENFKFQGAVLSDLIVDIIYEEFQEDISKLAGLQPRKHKEDKLPSAFQSFKRRLPWLLIGLVGGLFAAKLISSFESTLLQNIVLAAFIPLITYIASAIQNQTSVFIIRDLALNKKLKFVSYGLKQLEVVSLIGVVISLIVFFSSYLFYSNLQLSYVLGLSLLLAVLSSLLTGVIIPFAFSRLKYDPADASGPIATIIQDIVSVLIYLLVAKSLL